MLKPEQALARLLEWKLPEDANRVADGVQRLPTKLRHMAARAYGVEVADESKANLPHDWQERRNRLRAAAIAIDALPIKDRALIFRVVSPGLAPTMEKTWQLLKSTPYQVGHRKKAFRAPRHPAMSADRLYRWLSGFGSLSASYPADVLTPNWLATWAIHLASGYQVASAYQAYADEIGTLLAAVLNEDGEEATAVFATLNESLLGQHEIGGPGRHIYTAFLLSSRPDAWEAVEKTLLAAQRQEGVRQAILEAIDLAHPLAFRRVLRLILDKGLYRFSSVVRAVDVWFGELWAAASGGVIKKMLEQVVELLESPTARERARKGKDAEAAFLALWCAATEDAEESIGHAEELLHSKSVEMRYVAARHLVNLDFSAAAAALVPALDDDDLRVAILAAAPGYLAVDSGDLPGLDDDDRFERLERLVDRVPSKSQKLKPIVWPWAEMSVKQSQVAAVLPHTLGQRAATRLIPHLGKMEPYVRRHAVEKIVEAKPWDTATRRALVELAGDTSEVVRAVALEALVEQSLKSEEVERLESYLTRKVGDLRRGVLAILLKQADSEVLASSERLLAAKDAKQRLAGLELLRLMSDAQRSVAECRNQATAYQASRKKLAKEEQGHLAEIATEKVAAATLDDALGLMNLAERTPVIAPRDRSVPFITLAAESCLKGLDDLVHEYRETTIRYESYSGQKEELLGNVQWGFPSPDYSKARAGQMEKLPLAEVWTNWYSTRDPALRDEDGFELVRAFIWSAFCDEWQDRRWTQWAESSPHGKTIAEAIAGGRAPEQLRYRHIVADVVEWLLFLIPRDSRSYLLDALESAYALVPGEMLKELTKPRKETKARSYFEIDIDSDWRGAKAFEIWRNAMSHEAICGDTEPTAEWQVRLWKVMRWCDEPVAGAPRRRVDSDVLRVAYSEGAANLADVADHLLGPRGSAEYAFKEFNLLTELSARKPEKDVEKWLARHPEVRDLVERAIARIVDLELSRGDAPTAATAPAHSLDALFGVETLRRILHALGQSEFKLESSWRFRATDDRRSSLTQLARKTFPTEGETLDDFASAMQLAVSGKQFPEERVLQLVFLAPQWVKHVEAYFKWSGMDEGLYWFLAHMRYVGGLENAAAEAADETATAVNDSAGDNEVSANDSPASSENDGSPKRKLSAWDRLVLERTPLTDAERQEGAIDVHWFERTYRQLGERRWQQLATAARFAANASQAKRAAFVADVLLGRVSRKQLIEGIKKRQLKDHVRLLGLLPLAKGERRAVDLLERCKVLREYRRYASQLSGLTKPAAMRSWEIGMRNMAQTAGYADPLRLEWAVGAEAVKDLAKGPVIVKKQDIAVSLSLDDMSKPVVSVLKGNKPLKSIPPVVKKDKKVAELISRVTDLKRQAAGIRQSLEAAMCRGDTFTGSELRDWCGHALLVPLLSRLVVAGEGILGYPDKQGRALRDFSGKLEPIKAKELLRLAHPTDLLESNAWHDWQRECFQAERVQPFKQVFRELYVVTKQERQDGAVSHRYDGQQIQPRQGMALFGQRGWNTQDGIFKVFYDAQLTANVGFQSGIGTPLEVEGATLAGVSFTRRDEWKPIPLVEVPARLFSEVMRDVDLVVSVAHAGGVDPEASASTVEMRATLVRETCSLLGLTNVRLKPSHAVVDGQLANYSVHLGSGTVHRMPGGSLCVVPVHSQHRGRLFLPFADDDPRTAEVISKVLLFARDQEIQDPSILEQIRA